MNFLRKKERKEDHCGISYYTIPADAPNYFSVADLADAALKIAEQHSDWAANWAAANFYLNACADCCACIRSDRFAPVADVIRAKDATCFAVTLEGYNVSPTVSSKIYLAYWVSKDRTDKTVEAIKALCRIYEDAVYKVVQENQDRFDER